MKYGYIGNVSHTSTANKAFREKDYSSCNESLHTELQDNIKDN